MANMNTRYKLILSVVLAWTQVLMPVMAQDAFYVYRNDGDFNGFFYDEVIRMGYSKIDPQGIEHEEYVIQEIETADSLYRIPICAIDSIGFQQPEIRLNPRVRFDDDEGLFNPSYFWGVDPDARILYFLSTPPDEFMPKIGDVLVCLETTQIPGGSWAGKITSFKKNRFFEIHYDDLSEISDVFEQFISVEQLYYDQENNVRRRIAGFNNEKLRKQLPLKLNGNFDLSIIDWSGRIQMEFKPTEKSSINVGIDVGVKVGARFVYRIEGLLVKRFYVKGMLSEDFSIGASVSASINAHWDSAEPLPISIPPIKFPANIPLLEINPSPGAFVRVDGSLAVTIPFEAMTFGATQTLTIDTDDPWLVSLKWGNRDEKEKSYDLLHADMNWIDLNTTLSGYVQLGAKQECGIKTNQWFKKLVDAYTGMDIYVGPKLDGAINFSTAGAIGGGFYGAMKDSYIGFTPLSIDREAKAKFSVFNGEPTERVFYSDSRKYAYSQWYLFPEFLDTKAEYDEQKNKIDAAVYPRRQVCKSSDIGIGLYRYTKDPNTIYDEQEEEEQTTTIDTGGEEGGQTTQGQHTDPMDKATTLVESVYNSTPYSFTNNFVDFKHTFTTGTGTAPGNYTVVPMVRSFGMEMPVWDKKVDIDIPVQMELSPEFLTVDKEAGTHSVTVNTNGDKVSYFYDMRVHEYGDKEWLECDAPEDGKTVTIKVKENPYFYARTDTITILSWLENAPGTTGHKRLPVKQHGCYDIGSAYLQLGIPVIDGKGNEVYSKFNATLNRYNSTFQMGYFKLTIDAEFENIPYVHSDSIGMPEGYGTPQTYTQSGKDKVHIEVDLSEDNPRVTAFTFNGDKQLVFRSSGQKTYDPEPDRSYVSEEWSFSQDYNESRHLSLTAPLSGYYDKSDRGFKFETDATSPTSTSYSAQESHSFVDNLYDWNYVTHSRYFDKERSKKDIGNSSAYGNSEGGFTLYLHQ